VCSWLCVHVCAIQLAGCIDESRFHSVVASYQRALLFVADTHTLTPPAPATHDTPHTSHASAHSHRHGRSAGADSKHSPTASLVYTSHTPDSGHHRAVESPQHTANRRRSHSPVMAGAGKDHKNEVGAVPPLTLNVEAADAAAVASEVTVSGAAQRVSSSLQTYATAMIEFITRSIPSTPAPSAAVTLAPNMVRTGSGGGGGSAGLSSVGAGAAPPLLSLFRPPNSPQTPPAALTSAPAPGIPTITITSASALPIPTSSVTASGAAAAAAEPVLFLGANALQLTRAQKSEESSPVATPRTADSSNSSASSSAASSVATTPMHASAAASAASASAASVVSVSVTEPCAALTMSSAALLRALLFGLSMLVPRAACIQTGLTLPLLPSLHGLAQAIRSHASEATAAAAAAASALITQLSANLPSSAQSSFNASTITSTASISSVSSAQPSAAYQTASALTLAMEQEQQLCVWLSAKACASLWNGEGVGVAASKPSAARAGSAGRAGSSADLFASTPSAAPVHTPSASGSSTSAAHPKDMTGHWLDSQLFAGGLRVSAAHSRLEVLRARLKAVCGVLPRRRLAVSEIACVSVVCSR
jgi:hypothetical protein